MFRVPQRVGREESSPRRASGIQTDAFEVSLLTLRDVARDSLWHLVKLSKRRRPVSQASVKVETELIHML